MMRIRATRILVSIATFWAMLQVVVEPAGACSRFVYLGRDGKVFTARSMDWEKPIGTDLYILPRGMARNGEVGPASIRWTSKYGSLVATAFDNSTSDGANEEGLTANVLWLEESQYPAFDGKGPPGLAISVWAQYALDNFATVDEAVVALEKQPFTLVTSVIPGTQVIANVHMSLSDSSGDSAIIEYIDGKQVIHHGRQYQVMTNSPTYEQQLALASYWSQIGGTVMLPGTNRASDRFARASFYVKSIPQDGDPDHLLASVYGIIRNVSVPLGLSTPEKPEISSTRWRTVFDHKRRLYFFESALSPNTFWTDLNQIDSSKETGKVLKLDLGVDQANVFAGNATRSYRASEPFPFAGLPR
ncbi:UNVERIFIED_ORG: penicillin V acylase-like amidase (Ntn superfamily) [Methylobacterium sp. SuP10 SLI 274]|uniref:linear amide C-N hydrolase n=1 Tax=Methylorubrum extorquens TaxID=408 RepID=UPI0020A04DB3|nr:linear amide C-N hydrolase [Methylorubrum extorquens]MDF9792175.1 penicillin V acylase-like amidase (Ntn superfamily) [Methylorubrum extorquens]MDF9863860.1 penicillin V acylase-like amidase (Ntn superfamily) [Methylorubrum pseudosasae]MDH6637458.1 penicillin V acylase-like amidase (Ntn superfamily) [Methylobacterium sp. SuP10 SLI 274]MDH6666638.1 penicillin V acylase-like amidase (Ntn superfamily) [Methylorubrum zatmanii]